ncbi:hypothetical protein PG995_006868 [Apiospora arundinis]
MYSPGNKGTLGVQKASSKFSVLGPRTQGASVQKAKSMAPRRDAKDREASIVTAFAASVADSVSSYEPGIQNPIRRARVFSDRTFDFSMSHLDIITKLGGIVNLSENVHTFLEDLTAQGMIQGLNNLQHSSKGQLVSTAIETPTRHWLRFVPRTAEGKIYYASPGEYEFNQLFGWDIVEHWTVTMERILNDSDTLSRLFRGFFENEYTLFNWNTGGHWGTCLIHMETDADNRYTHVVQIGVMDSFQEDSTMVWVHQRMRAILEFLGCTFASGNIERTFWLPRQRDGYSCGLVTAYTNRLLIERISDFYLPSGPQEYDDESLWRPAREHFDPFQFQGELSGLCAVELMHHTGYNSRLAVAMVNRVTNTAVDPSDRLAMAVGEDPTALREGYRATKPQKCPSLGYRQERLTKMSAKVKRAARKENRNNYGTLGGAPPAKQAKKPAAKPAAKPQPQQEEGPLVENRKPSIIEKLKKARIYSALFDPSTKKPAPSRSLSRLPLRP